MWFYLTLFDIGASLSITVHAGNVPRSSKLSNLHILTIKENSLLHQVKRLMPISIVTDLQGSAIRMLWRYGSGRAKLGIRKINFFFFFFFFNSWELGCWRPWRLSLFIWEWPERNWIRIRRKYRTFKIHHFANHVLKILWRYPFKLFISPPCRCRAPLGWHWACEPWASSYSTAFHLSMLSIKKNVICSLCPWTNCPCQRTRNYGIFIFVHRWCSSCFS